MDWKIKIFNTNFKKKNNLTIWLLPSDTMEWGVDVNEMVDGKSEGRVQRQAEPEVYFPEQAR